MPKKRHSAEEIIVKLREADVLLGQGRTVAEVARALAINETTYYRWRAEYGGMKVSQARRLKELERENARLRKAVADLTLDKQILKEAAGGNFFSIRGPWVNPLAWPGLPSRRAVERSCGALASLRGRRIGRRHDGIRRRGRSHLSRAVGVAAAQVSPVSPVPPSPQGPPPLRRSPEAQERIGVTRPRATSGSPSRRATCGGARSRACGRRRRSPSAGHAAWPPRRPTP